MTNLRGKHKQIYNLTVKAVDPQVNWAALVEEKLVQPRLPLAGARGGPQVCRGRTPPFNVTTVMPGGNHVPDVF